MLLEKDSEEWGSFLNKLERSKMKSNRDVLCLQCWRILKYEECVRHKILQGDHTPSILTSKDFASEFKFVAIAQGLGKVQIVEGREMFENPYRSDKKKGKGGFKSLSYTNPHDLQERENEACNQNSQATIEREKLMLRLSLSNQQLVVLSHQQFSELKQSITTLEQKIEDLSKMIFTIGTSGTRQYLGNLTPPQSNNYPSLVSSSNVMIKPQHPLPRHLSSSNLPMVKRIEGQEEEKSMQSEREVEALASKIIL